MFFLELLAAFNEKYKIEMRAIYKETETVLKIIVTSYKLRKRNRKLKWQGNQKSKPSNQNK